MPTFVVTAPDGKEYEITAPEGATQEQVLAYAQANYGKAEAPKQEEPGLGSSILRQLGLTARAGITGAASIPAMLADPLVAGINLATGRQQPLPSRALQTVMTEAGLPEPQGRLERAVQTGASALAGVGSQIGLAQRAGEAFRPLTQEAGRQMAAAGAAGTVAQPVAEVVGERTESPAAAVAAALVAGTVAGQAGAKTAGALQGRQPSMSIEQIRQRAAQQYKTMAEQGVVLKKQSVNDAFDMMELSLRKNGFDPDVVDTHKPVMQQIESLKKATEQGPVSFERLEKMRGQLSDLKGSREPATRKFAGQAVAELDNYIASLGARDLFTKTGDVGKAVKAVEGARKDWRNLSKASILENALDVAEARALAPQASDSELIRRQLINLAADKNKMRQFTQREQNAIKSVAKGGATDPILSLLARFNPERSQLAVGGLAFTAASNPAAALAAGGAGFAADKTLGLLRQQAANRLVNQIASGTLPPEQINMTARALAASVPQEPRE